MSHNIRRRIKRSWRRKESGTANGSGLQLENLERRVLLDVAGYWDELGWRSASGGGISWDESSDPGEAQLVLSEDGDPVVLWIEGTFNEYVETPIPFHWEVEGSIYARQYAADIGWWDLTAGGGDDLQFGAIDTTEITDAGEAASILEALRNPPHPNEPLVQVWEGATLRVNSPSSQMTAATGPDGRIVVAWAAVSIPNGIDNGVDNEIYVKMWDGANWVELGNSARGGGVSSDNVTNEKPDVAFNELGEIFLSYTAIHPLTGQREIVVKKYGYDYGTVTKMAGPPAATDLVWVELVSEEVDLFGVNDTSGVSNDLASSFDSSITVNAEGRPIVVWTNENDEGNLDIYLKRWDGNDWSEFGLGSASDTDSDGVSGISNDQGISIQPDVAVAPNNDVIVTWVNWADWANYDNPNTGGGKAGIYVKLLAEGSGVWVEYANGVSTTGPGIAPSQAWYYEPQIDVTSNSEPFITWQGWGTTIYMTYPERYQVDRDSTASNDPDGYHSPDLPGNPDRESPVMGIYASHFTEAAGFSLLPNPNDPSGERANPTAIVDGVPREYHCWMPTALLGPNDELLMGYTWRDTLIDLPHNDSEIFVQQWDANAGTWQSYGRGSNFNGNDVFGGPVNSAGYLSENYLELTEADVQLGLIDFDSDPTTEMDVMLANGEHVYLYNRNLVTEDLKADAWSVIDPAGGYGQVFDLRGEPEVAHNVAGSPLLAYIDTDVFSPTYGLPFVLRWGGGTWNVVGGGAASPHVGSTPFDGYPAGITVQAGSNGSIFLAYMAFDGISVDVLTRLWDGTSWSNAGPESEISPGVFVSAAPEGSILQPVFYADFDAYNFDGIDITETGLDDDGNVDPGFVDREVGEWYLDVYERWAAAFDNNLYSFGNNRGYFDGDDDDGDTPGEVEVQAEGDVTAGPYYIPGDYGQDDEALVLKLTINENDYLGYLSNTRFQASLINHFRLIEEDHVMIEMMYAVDTLNMDVNLYLVLDREIVDVNPNDAIPLSPINSIVAGTSETWDQGDLSTLSTNIHSIAVQDGHTIVSLDTQQMQNLDGEPLDPLAMGEHEVIVLAVPRVTSPDLGPDVFERNDEGIPTDMRFVFPEEAEEDFDGWTFPAADTTTCEWLPTVGSGGDGGLELTIDDNTSTNFPTEYSGWIERSFSLYGGGGVSVELSYEMDPTGLAVGDLDTLDLQVFLVEPGPFGAVTELNELGDYQAVQSDGVIAHNTITVDSTALDTLAPGTYTIRIAAVLTDEFGAGDSTGILRLDDIVLTTTDEVITSDFDTDPQMEGWGYEDMADPNDDVDGAWALDANLTESGASPGGGLLMEFTDNVNQTNNHGAFFYDFTYGGPVTIEFDYELTVEAAVPADASVIMLVSIDGNYLLTTDPDQGDLEFIAATSDNTDPQTEIGTFEITLETLDNDAYPGLNSLASGPHVIRIEALLEDNGAGGGGVVVATMAIDNFRLYGIDSDDDDVEEDELPDWLEPDPHRVHVQVDNFSVYQRVVSGKAVDDTENLLDTNGPIDFDGLGGVLPADWTYMDTPGGDPGGDPGEVVGVQDDDAGAGGIGDGALVMTLGDNVTITEDLQGQFLYTFTLDGGSFLDVELDYYLETDLNINAFETLDLTISIEGMGPFNSATIHTDQLIASGGGSYTTGWQTLRLTDVGHLNFFGFGAEYEAFAAGTYDLVINAELSRSGRDRVGYDGTLSEDDTAGQAFVKIDNVTVKEYQGAGDWEYEDAGGDTGSDWGMWGSNDAVGPDPDTNDGVREGVYDFGGCIHSSLAGAGSQRYVIENVTQWEGGDMVVGFRYRLDSYDPLSVSVLVDGVEYNELSENAPITPTYFNGWWNYVDDEPAYTYVTVRAENIAAGDHTISLELTNTGITQTELYIDNLFILGTPVINAVQPQATLLPTGSDGKRHFALGLSSQAPNVLVYEDSEDVYPDGPMLSLARAYDVLNGYQAGAIFELVPGTNEWLTYGELLDSTESINYFRDINDATLSGGAFNMPVGEIYFMEDFIIGPNAMVWVALQHAETEWVDINDPPDGINDVAVVDPWDSNDWGGATILDLAVWRWDPFSDPTQVSGQTQLWEDTGFVPFEEYWAYTDVELVGSGGQLPSVGWTGRDGDADYYSSYVQRYEPGDVWGVLGTEDVQNTEYWSAAWLRDMIVRDDGLPIVNYYMGHLATDGVREFRRAETIPLMNTSEFSGTQDDGILEFGTLLNVPDNQGFSIFNSGPGDLMIYDVEIGGYGSLASSPFTLFNAPQFPITLEPGEQEAIIVRFNPTNVPVGEYTAVLRVHTNNITHPTHPFTHFQEMQLTAEVTNGAEVYLDTNFLDFEDTVVHETSTAQEVVISNQGSGPLTLHQWFFDDDNYEIVQAFITTISTGGGVVQTPVSVTNIADPGDDVMIPAGSALTLQIVFMPDDVAVFNETLYIKTNDDDEPFVVVAVTGRGVSGAQIVIEENSGLLPNDDIIDFGSVVMGTTSAPIPLVINNNGTTDLEISDIYVDTQAAAVLYIQPTWANPFTLVPGSSVVIEAYYAPTFQGPTGDIDPIDLETRIFIISDDEVIPTYEITVFATAVPMIPIIEITDDAGVEMAVPRLDFGIVNVGQVVTQTFGIANIGGADLTLQSFIINTLDTPFIVAPVNTASLDDDIILGLGETQIVTVTFAPTEVGFVQNTLGIRSNDHDNPNYLTDVILQGAAINPVLEVTESYQDPNDRFIDFGLVGRNQSVTESIFLTNVGDSDITITDWSSDNPAFSISPALSSPVVIAPDQQQELIVMFTPSLITSYPGLITITSNDPTNPSWVVTVTGQGVAPGQVAITDSETASPHGVINFTTPFGQPLVAGFDSAQEFFTLANNGDSDLLIKGILITSVYGPDAPNSWSDVELTSSPFSLNIPGLGKRMDPDNPADDISLSPGESIEVAVAFAPANKFDDQLWVTIITNDPAESEPDAISHVIMSGESIFALKVGESAGIKQPKTIFYDETGDQVQIKVTGGGFAVVVLENGAATDSDIERIELFNTTKKSSLTVISKNETHVGQIIGDTVKNVTLKNVILDGAGLVDNAIELGTLTGTLSIQAIVNGADIYIGGVNSNGKGAKIKLGQVEDDSALIVDGPVSLLQATSYGDGMIQASSMNKLKAGPGDFDAHVVVAEDLNAVSLSSWKVDADFRIGGDVNKITANKASFTGTLSADNINKLTFYRLQGAEIGIRELLSKLTVNSNAADSRILAGYDPDTHALFSGGEIGSVTVKELFANSNISAGVAPYSDSQFFHPTFQNETRSGSIGNVVLGSVDWDNSGTLFGVSATSSIDKVQAGNITFHPDADQVDFRVLLLN